MTPRLFALVLISVSLSAMAQMLLKWGMSSPDVARALANGSPCQLLLTITTRGSIILGLSVYFASAAVWLFVLAQLQVSFAYPFVGLGFILTMLMGGIFFGDAISINRVIGTLLVALGVALIARS